MNRHLITTAATLTRCPRCGVWTLTGHAEGEPARADPLPLDEHGEYAALMAGRTTYNLHVEITGRRYLTPRTSIEIAAPRRCVVVTAHRCGRPIGSAPPPPPPGARAASGPAPDDEPPF